MLLGVKKTLVVAGLGGLLAGACIPAWSLGGSGGSGGVTASSGAGGKGGATASSGAGGKGGATASSGAGGKGGTTASGGSGGTCDVTACDGGNTEAGCALVIVEVAVHPSDAEYVAIYNPCDTSVDLTNHYLADFNTYYLVVNNEPPLLAANGSDFVARFPAGASIGPGQKQYVSIAGGACFKGSCPTGMDPKFKGYGFYPHYELAYSASVDAGVLRMVRPFGGAVGDAATLTNPGEPVVLFFWDGGSNLVTDVDYVYYGLGAPPSAVNAGVNKACQMVGTEMYLPDTPFDPSKSAPLLIDWHDSGVNVTCRKPYVNSGDGKCGNGVSGSDQTAEQWSVTWWACPDLDGGN